ncbi:MFS transporter [Desulfosporosinus sp. Sb-LF]|uniref:MFS transporter n=1 Tax=Desulfosporosinus sp. Sb-LF TaxID=2560027 RepID=UPI001A7E7C7E|nr:MFS transporter [Desulfosporosinus sp. Sb-LF]
MRATTRMIGHYLFIYGAIGIYLPFLPLFLAANGLDSLQIGFLMAIGPSTSIFTQIAWGNFADKHNRRKEYLVIAVTGTALVCITLTFFKSLSWLALLLFFYALFNSATSPLTDSLALDTVADTRHFGLFRRWGSLGFAVTAVTGGLLFSYLPVSLFGAVAGSLYAMTLLWTVSLPNPRKWNRPARAAFPLIEVLKVPGVKQLLFVLLLVMVPYAAYSSFLGWHLQSLGASRLWVGIAWTVAAISEVPIFGMGSRWLIRTPARSLMAGAALIFSVRWLAYAYIQSYPIIVFLQLAQSLSFALFYLAAVEYLTKLVSDELRSSAQSLMQCIGFGVSAIVGSTIGGWLVKTGGIFNLYIVMAVLSGLGALGSFTWLRYKS